MRCYLVRDSEAGFGAQLVNALYPAEPDAAANSAPQPGARLYYPPTRADFQRLKDRLEREWLDQLCGIVGVEKTQLPILWDADFLYGERRHGRGYLHPLRSHRLLGLPVSGRRRSGPLVTETLAQIERLR